MSSSFSVIVAFAAILCAVKGSVSLRRVVIASACTGQALTPRAVRKLLTAVTRSFAFCAMPEEAWMTIGYLGAFR